MSSSVWAPFRANVLLKALQPLVAGQYAAGWWPSGNVGPSDTCCYLFGSQDLENAGWPTATQSDCSQLMYLLLGWLWHLECLKHKDLRLLTLSRNTDTYIYLVIYKLEVLSRTSRSNLPLNLRTLVFIPDSAVLVDYLCSVLPLLLTLVRYMLVLLSLPQGQGWWIWNPGPWWNVSWVCPRRLLECGGISSESLLQKASRIVLSAL